MECLRRRGRPPASASLLTPADAFITLSAEHTAFPIKDAPPRHRSPCGHHRTLTSSPPRIAEGFANLPNGVHSFPLVACYPAFLTRILGGPFLARGRFDQVSYHEARTLFAVGLSGLGHHAPRPVPTQLCQKKAVKADCGEGGHPRHDVPGSAPHVRDAISTSRIAERRVGTVAAFEIGNDGLVHARNSGERACGGGGNGRGNLQGCRLSARARRGRRVQ